MAAQQAPQPDLAHVAAKKTLANICDALTSQSTYFAVFDESKGSVDYARWRRDLFTFVGSAGVDFTAALAFRGAITPITADYDQQFLSTEMMVVLWSFTPCRR